MPGVDWFTLSGVLLLLIAAYGYADRKRHPRRRPWAAFLVFVSVFGGIAVAGVVVAAGVVHALGLAGADAAAAVTLLVPVLFFAVIAPAFVCARRLIQRPPGGAS